MTSLIVECRQCNNRRTTYNDPRAGATMIECKARCFETHGNWEYKGEEAPAAPAAAAASPVRRAESASDRSDSDDGSPERPPAAKRNAFGADEDDGKQQRRQRDRPATPQPEEDKGACCVVS
jgi:hypothetical protein